MSKKNVGTVSSPKRTEERESMNQVLAEAQKKTGAKTALSLARYLPVEKGADAAMHHLALNSLLSTEPKLAVQLIKEYILSVENPIPLRSPNSKKGTKDKLLRKKTVTIGIDQAEKILSFLNKSGRKDLIEQMDANIYSDTGLRRSLRDAIAKWECRQDLWDLYIRRCKERGNSSVG